MVEKALVNGKGYCYLTICGCPVRRIVTLKCNKNLKTLKPKKSTILEFTAVTVATVVIGYLISQAGTRVMLVSILVITVLCLWAVSRLIVHRINQLQIQLNDRRKQFMQLIEDKFLRQEEFIALNGALNPRYPLPALTKSTVTPALANIIMRTIAEHKPKVIVECGSGVSTLIVCYCLSRNESGHVHSLDHMTEYAQITRETLRLHSLSEYGTVYVADLVDVHIDQVHLTWYNPEVLANISEIDLLIVDGPPGHLSKMARYPAIPVLLSKLNKGAVVLVDDYDRPDEKSMVKEWCGKYGFTMLQKYEVEKGACALRRS